jgi:predicted transcriptional regulator
MPEVPMLRTQVYLTERQGERLKALARAKRRSRSQLIRDAVDALLAAEKEEPRGDWREATRRVAGMWADYPEVEEIIAATRRSFDRPPDDRD